MEILKTALLLFLLSWPAHSGQESARVQLGMTYREVFAVLGPPTEMSFVLGFTRLEFSENEQIWFKDGRATLGTGFIGSDLPEVEDYVALHDHYEGDGCEVRSSIYEPYHWEIMSARRTDEARNALILGQPFQSSDASEDNLFQSGFLRGFKGARVVAFTAGREDTTCAGVAFKMGSPSEIKAPQNGWFSPLPHLQVLMRNGLVAELNLYVEDDALFSAIDEAKARGRSRTRSRSRRDL